jgi:hypothetical protein
LAKAIALYYHCPRPKGRGNSIKQFIKLNGLVYFIMKVKMNKKLKTKKVLSKKEQKELEEDLRDLKYFKLRAKEPTISYEEIKKQLFPIKKS